MTGCGARSTSSLWVHRNLFWRLSRDRNLHSSGISHATTASPKQNPSGHLGGWVTPWWADEQRKRVDISDHARTADKGLLQRKTGRGSNPESSLMSPRMTQLVKGLNRTELTILGSCATWAATVSLRIDLECAVLSFVQTLALAWLPKSLVIFLRQPFRVCRESFRCCGYDAGRGVAEVFAMFSGSFACVQVRVQVPQI